MVGTSPTMTSVSAGPMASAARHRVDVLDRARQRHRCPGLAAILGAENLALVARADVDLLGVGLMQAHRHDRTVHLHLVEALPGLACVLAAIEPAILARGRNAERAVHGLAVLRRNLHVAPIGDRREPLHLHVLPTA